MDFIGKKVVVTTDKDKRGVFFGTVQSVDRVNKDIVLENAQNCVYWSRNVRGFVGLAATGPDIDSRVTKPAPAAELTGYTSILLCTEDAATAWEAEPWGE